MPHFSQSTLIDAPVEAVFAFHERPDALTLLSPPFPPVRLLSRTGRGIEAGAELELRIGPLRWLARHTHYEPNRLFVDEQIAGPFARWIHRHEFTPAGAQTRLTDHIDFQLPGGPLVNSLFAWAVKLSLRDMFNHRHRVTRQLTHG
ncbi:MAG: SRPBCC family protein [Acidobacteria bacterium]|nr:SRPBCC family protein [Acidobacteriota bacterium]